MSVRPSIAGGILIALMLFATAFPADHAEAASAPDWVDRSGLSQAYPQGAFLTGFAATTGKEEALESYVIIPDGADQVRSHPRPCA